MRFRLPQVATYWTPTGPGQFGRMAFAVPTFPACRWEDKIQETINSDGDTVLSSATVYLAVSVAVGGLLVLGRVITNPADPRTVVGIREIISLGSVPSLTGRQTLYTAMLK